MNYALNFKPYYDNQSQFQKYSETASISTSIQNPFSMYGETYWCVSSTKDNWNKSISSFTLNNNNVTKTIFDPNPSNYLMPKTACFTGFVTNSGSINAAGPFNKGYNIYTQPNGIGGTIFIYALGARSRITGILNGYGDYIYVWVSGAGTENGRAYYLELDTSYFQTANCWYTGNGFNIIGDKQ